MAHGASWTTSIINALTLRFLLDSKANFWHSCSSGYNILVIRNLNRKRMLQVEGLDEYLVSSHDPKKSRVGTFSNIWKRSSGFPPKSLSFSSVAPWRGVLAGTRLTPSSMALVYDTRRTVKKIARYQSAQNSGLFWGITITQFPFLVGIAGILCIRKDRAGVNFI